MSFLEIQFPENDSVSLAPRGGAMFNTGIIPAASGFEQRNQWWSMPRRKWDIAKSAISEDDKDAILAFFMVAAGKANGFRKRDWTDFELDGGVIGTGDGNTKTFQLKKTYTVGAQSVTVNIKKPITSAVVNYANVAQLNTVHIYKDGVEALTGWTVSHATGIVTFTAAPAGGIVITADCEFDIPVRFDNDFIEATILENKLPGYRDGGYYTFASLSLIEVRI